VGKGKCGIVERPLIFLQVGVAGKKKKESALASGECAEKRERERANGKGAER